jgi:uncharacterized membrane protein YdbT with pleckstrin-like domain
MRTDDLLPGERVIGVFKQHWVVLLPSLAIWGLGGVIVLSVLLLLPIGSQQRGPLLVAVVLIAGLALAVAFLRWRANEVMLTDQRVVLNEGLIGRFSRSIAIDRIQDLTTYQGLWGRTWGFGDIELESAGRDGGEWLTRMPHPQSIRNAIFSQIEARRSYYR